ncbi:MAG TPA: BON domain-containing protein [Pyrinomonadaceae bacterium]|nr:BON domain-containing protein [Pyrinomonadaceae bacterium]
MKLRLISLALALLILGCMTNQSRKSEPGVVPANRVEDLRRKTEVEYRDSLITHQITGSFAQAGLVDVRVRTGAGVVTLCGYVDTENQKKEAEEIAKGVAGVVAVANYITVSNPPVNTNKPGGPAQKPCDF